MAKYTVEEIKKQALDSKGNKSFGSPNKKERTEL
jgi:hypothetical protein